EEAELSRRDKFLVQELSILGQGIEPIQRANPVMRATDWKDTLRGWKSFLLEPEDTVEKERRRHLESLERLRALNDRRSFNALYHISYPEAYRYHPRTTVRAKEILFELIYLWNLDQFNTIEQAIEKRIEELKNSSHYVMLNGRHDPGSVRLIEKEEKYRKLLLHARESYDPTIQDGTNETSYNYLTALEGAATVPKDIIGFFLFDTLLSNHPKNLIALPTRFVSGLLSAVYHGIKDIPDEISGLFTAGHYGASGYELGQKTANTVIVLVPTVKLAKQLAHYQIRLPEQYFGDRGNAQRPSPNGINPYVPDLSPKPEWGNPHPFDNTYRPQLPTQTPQGSVATLVNPFTEVLPKLSVPDVLPQELWLDTLPTPHGITFVIPPGDYFPERKGKIKVIIIRKDNDGNILGYEETEIDEDTVLLGFNIPKNKTSDLSGPQASTDGGENVQGHKGGAEEEEDPVILIGVDRIEVTDSMSVEEIMARITDSTIFANSENESIIFPKLIAALEVPHLKERARNALLMSDVALALLYYGDTLQKKGLSSEVRKTIIELTLSSIVRHMKALASDIVQRRILDRIFLAQLRQSKELHYPILKELKKDGNDSTRLHAERILEILESEDSLLEQLKGNEAVRERAAIKLAQMEIPPILELIQALENPETEEGADYALRLIGFRKANLLQRSVKKP
ncbi:MAG: hypothetical protein HYW47_00295, partial [Deltaproteobacteria bacterium]|nr:hypothetical protein [Deltaproteobacteria bacterium]